MTGLEKRALWIVLAFYILGWVVVWCQSPAKGIELSPKSNASSSSLASFPSAMQHPEVYIDTVALSNGARSSFGVSSASQSPRSNHDKKIVETSKETISINRATLEQLQRLPGVGPSLAKNILEYRNRHGKIKNAQEMLDIKGIGEKKLNSMQAHITFEP